MNLLITGASGYIGSCLVNTARKRGYRITAAGRRRVPGCDHWIPYDLNESVALVLPRETHVVIHLAADTSSAGGSTSEFEAAINLLGAATRIGARVVFVSSQTARPDAPTHYGRTKWQIEQRVLAAGGIVIRPGLVYGGPERGLFGRLVQLVRNLPVLPAFFPSPRVQPVHVEDLCEVLLRSAQGSVAAGRILCVAASDPLGFDEFLRAIARYRLGKLRLFLPMPAKCASLLMDGLGGRLRARLGLTGLYSLFDLPVMETAADLRTLELTPRTLAGGMTAAGARRELLCEGQTLLRYVLKREPGADLIRRYALAVSALGDGTPMGLPRLYVSCPALLSMLDGPLSSRVLGRSLVEHRLAVAASLAEASIQGALVMLGTQGRLRWMRAASAIVLVGCKELAWSLLVALLFPCLRLQLRKLRVDAR